MERLWDGWRSGKPVEDPDKLKRWGYIGAKPSEFLVVTKGGQIDRKRSGQGARVFKWPWYSIAVVPTTLQRIEFTADQVTRERVGVEISGIAVYRIAEPLLAFRVLNFTYGEAASEKLGATLREMFVGAARRLVANLALDECLTRRKETIASFLMEEIAPVVGGDGSPDDTTTRGWGVVIDTIEIQQVRIQSAQVFAHLQAPFRAEIAAQAELAELERARQVAERRAHVAQEASRDRGAPSQGAGPRRRRPGRPEGEAARPLGARRVGGSRSRSPAPRPRAGLRRREAEARDHRASWQRRRSRLAEIEQLPRRPPRLSSSVAHALLQMLAQAHDRSWSSTRCRGAGPLDGALYDRTDPLLARSQLSCAVAD